MDSHAGVRLYVWDLHAKTASKFIGGVRQLSPIPTFHGLVLCFEIDLVFHVLASIRDMNRPKISTRLASKCSAYTQPIKAQSAGGGPLISYPQVCDARNGPLWVKAVPDGRAPAN